MEMFVFTGIIWKESDEYSALCPELDIASQGGTVAEARNNLLETAALHLEGSFKDDLPYSRPVPASEDLRNFHPGDSLKVFKFEVKSDQRYASEK
jgi:predicted RNase H-like HicB family nuclease